MRQRSIGAIAPRPSNERGGFYFMSLNTGRLIHAFTWEELSIDDHVITRVVQLAEADGAPLMNNGPIFEWRPDIPVIIYEDEDILNDDEDDADESCILQVSDNDDDSELNDDDYAQEDIDDAWLHDVQIQDDDEPDEPTNDPPLVQGANDKHTEQNQAPTLDDITIEHTEQNQAP